MKSACLLISILALAACQPAAPPATSAMESAESTRDGASAAAEPETPASLASTVIGPVAGGGATDAAFWFDPGQPGEVLLIAAAGPGGLEVWTPDGQRLGSRAGFDATLVDVLEGFDGGEPLVVVYDARLSTLRAFVLDRAARSLEPVPATPVEIGDELVGLCSHRSRLSGRWFVFGVTDAGLLLQWELHRNGDAIGSRFIRSVPAGKGSGYCVVDPNDGMLYLSDEELGVWRFSAEPESETVREAVDLAAPWGRLGEEVKGIGLYRLGPDRAYLVLADAGAGLLRAWSLPDVDYLGAVAIAGLSEAEGLAVSGGGSAPGWLAIADEDVADGASDFRLVAWNDLAGALGLDTASGTDVVPAPVAVVRARLETPPVASWGDAADDPAIWVHPQDPALSLVLGTDKQIGLHVYDLAGRELQFLGDGRINNVDVRDGFRLGGESVTLVGAGNRSDNSFALYRLDPASRRLVDVADGHVPTGLIDTYGFCMYRSASGEFYAFANNGGDGHYVQSRLYESSPGRVGAEIMREFVVGTQAEGCVADDETGALYVAEEGTGIYRYAAGPDGGDERTVIDTVDSGRLTADVEGLGLWIGPGGTGYLVASNQGADNYVVYRRDGTNEYVGTFHVIADPAAGIDGASETDGLEVTSTALGRDYPAGLLVVQDGRNLAPPERQNYKFVSWQEVARALGIE